MTNKKREDIMILLDEFMAQMEKEGKRIIGKNIKVERLFVRRDGFKDSDILHYDNITKEQFYYLTRCEFKIPLKKRLKLMDDQVFPLYLESDKITFFPRRFNWKKNTLQIMYEEL